MSKVAIQGDPSGTGTVTIAAPNTSTDRALVLPDSDGTLALTSQVSGMRNRIMNGKMDVAQRGTSFVSPALGAYFVDRWTMAGAGVSAVLTCSQQADTPSGSGFTNSLRAAVTTADVSIAAGDVLALEQRIEGYNVADLIGRTFTLSFWARSSKTGIHCVSLDNSGSDRSYIAEYTINTANTWEGKTITVVGGLPNTGTWNFTNGLGLDVRFALASGTTFQGAAGSWLVGNLCATSNQVNCLDTVGNIFAITGVQLEVGSVATPFEHRPYGAELSLCQRYYQSGILRWDGNATSGTSYSTPVMFSPAMRIGPTLVFASTQALNFPGTANAINVSSTGFYDYRAASGSGVANYVSTWTASAEL